MNLCEIGLFHIVFGVSKGTRDHYHEIGEDILIYIYIYVQNISIRMNFGGYGEGGGVHIPRNIFFVKIKSYVIFI